jgi:hypothetical protein
MQVTELQVQRSIEALIDHGHDPERAGDQAVVPSRDSMGGSPDGDARRLPDGLVALLVESPSIRDDRVEQARRQLEMHPAPTAEALAQRMVGRLVCDRLR